MKYLVNKQNRGAALITVLMIVFIVMTIISTMTIENYRTIRRLTNQKIKEQVYAILFTAMDFGRAGLATSGSTSPIDALTDLWAQPLPKTTIVDDIQMSGYISDEQGKFNLNDLTNNGVVDKKVLAQLITLFGYINVPLTLANSIALYMAAPQYQADIMQQYTNGKPSYRPSGMPLVDLSELLLVKGMTPKLVYKVSQYVTAIPKPIDYLIRQQQESGINSNPNQAANQNNSNSSNQLKVNINTASAEVIAAKSNMPLPIAQRIMTARKLMPFKTDQDITGFLAKSGIIQDQVGADGRNKIDTSLLTTKSSYFTIHAVADRGDYEFKWIALVYRPSRVGGGWPKVLWQHPE